MSQLCFTTEIAELTIEAATIRADADAALSAVDHLIQKIKSARLSARASLSTDGKLRWTRIAEDAAIEADEYLKIRVQETTPGFRAVPMTLTEIRWGRGQFKKTAELRIAALEARIGFMQALEGDDVLELERQNRRMLDAEGDIESHQHWALCHARFSA